MRGRAPPRPARFTFEIGRLLGPGTTAQNQHTNQNHADHYCHNLNRIHFSLLSPEIT